MNSTAESAFFAFCAAMLFYASLSAAAQDRHEGQSAALHGKEADFELLDPAEIEAESSFYSAEIEDSLFEKMKGNSYKDGCPVSRADLCCVYVLHKTLDGRTERGELVCNKKIADSVLYIFRKLYDAGYPVEKIRLIDEYSADDERSMSDNNSSCFNFRCISGTAKISRHGFGLAVDINPLYNPYVKISGGTQLVEPRAAAAYADREKEFPYKICRGDLCHELFTKCGFEWGGDWDGVKDWQHFEWPE